MRAQGLHRERVEETSTVFSVRALTMTLLADDGLRLMGVREEHWSMTFDELTALHDALSAVLSWPDVVRAEIARWLAPERPNGRDPHPPPIAATGKAPETSGFSPPARRGKPANVNAERKLLAAMRDAPGSSVAELARATGSGKSTAGERLRGLAARGAVVKDEVGRWRLVGEEASPPAGGPDPRPPQPPAG
jgi:hypothetical protein